jgi:hypothetical protein
VSLIYTALSSLEKKPAVDAMAAEPQIPMPPPLTSRKDSSRWLYAAVIGSIAAVVIGGAALALLRERAKEMPPPLAASVPSKATPAPQIAAPAAAQPAPLSVPVQPAPQSEPVQQASVPAPQTPAPTPVALVTKPAEQAAEAAPAEQIIIERPATPAVPPPAVATRTSRRAHPVKAAAVANEPAQATPAKEDLNRLATAAKLAIDAGNKSEAESALGQLAAHLPPESLSLLRLRAWQAQRFDDQGRAMALYGQIVARLPDDESASINLAVLNWKAGQRDEARRIVAALAERRPDSDTVRRYVVQFGER